MLNADVIIAGGGVAGLLMANAFSPSVDVLLVEQQKEIPSTKFWLTDQRSLAGNPDLAHCIDRQYPTIDFIAYDGFRSTLKGRFNLWHTDRLIRQLLSGAESHGVRILTDQRLYSIRQGRDRVIVRANSEEIQAKVMVDCMGLGSPLVASKGVVDITGYYFVHGAKVRALEDVAPVGLDNVILDRRPVFFELFPTADGTAHAAIIAPSTSRRADRPLKHDWNFIVQRSHYSRSLDWRGDDDARSYFGIIPVGRLRTTALDRVVFFGESGQFNPGASATGLTTMLRTYRAMGETIESGLVTDRLRRRDLLKALPVSMSPLNRRFQECLFERILSFNSDDFRQLVVELERCPDDVVNDLIFATFDFTGTHAAALATQMSRAPRGVLARTLMQSLVRLLLHR